MPDCLKPFKGAVTKPFVPGIVGIPIFPSKRNCIPACTKPVIKSSTGPEVGRLGSGCVPRKGASGSIKVVALDGLSAILAGISYKNLSFNSCNVFLIALALSL